MALLAGTAASMPAHAEPRVEERTRYYDVPGRDLAELRRSLRGNRPRDAGGNPFVALTEWSMEWSVDYLEEGMAGRRGGGPRRCRVEGHDVRIVLTTTMPRWPQRERARQDVVRAWDAFLQALQAHEDGHRALALDAARRVDALLGERREGEDCRALSRAIEKAVDRIQRRLAIDNRDFDRRTGHGVDAGVVL